MIILWHWRDRDIMREVAAKYPRLDFVNVIDFEDLATVIADVEVAVCGPGVYTQQVAELYRKRATRLRWIQFRSTGMDTIIPLGFPENVLITNAPGMSADTIAEHCFAMILAFIRQLPKWVMFQRSQIWSREAELLAQMGRLAGRTLVIVGYSAISRQIIKRAKAFGMRVAVVSRAEVKDNDIDMLYPRELLRDAARDADILVVATSLSAETRGMVDASVIDNLKKSTILVNVARGALIDEDALILALQEGRIGGACLDVLAVEPAPANHPLFQLPNVLITPHVASQGSDGTAAFVGLMSQQLDRYLNGEPLLNLINSRTRYAGDHRSPI